MARVSYELQLQVVRKHKVVVHTVNGSVISVLVDGTTVRLDPGVQDLLMSTIMASYDASKPSSALNSASTLNSTGATSSFLCKWTLEHMGLQRIKFPFALVNSIYQAEMRTAGVPASGPFMKFVTAQFDLDFENMRSLTVHVTDGTHEVIRGTVPVDVDMEVGQRLVDIIVPANGRPADPVTSVNATMHVWHLTLDMSQQRQVDVPSQVVHALLASSAEPGLHSLPPSPVQVRPRPRPPQSSSAAAPVRHTGYSLKNGLHEAPAARSQVNVNSANAGYNANVNVNVNANANANVNLQKRLSGTRNAPETRNAVLRKLRQREPQHHHRSQVIYAPITLPPRA